MFPGWTAADRLDPSPTTLTALRALGAAMKDDGISTESKIPAAYTYFGQFLDHDITLDEGSASIEALSANGLTPMTDLSRLRNSRTAATELDSVYYLGVPRVQEEPKHKLRLADVSAISTGSKPTLRPAGKADANDLPRQARHADKDEDRAAIIGDPRNDENTIVAQLHTAFLKAHNALVERGSDFDAARREMILRYQSVILDDFCARVCDPAVHADVRANGPRHWNVPSPADLFMPAEFAFAAYRFGHSMVRTNYNFNLNFNLSGEANTFPASLALLFTFTALSGNFDPGGPTGPDTDTLPENWIIEWERILPLGGGGPVQNAHAIDTRLTSFLFALRNKIGQPEGSAPGTPQTVRDLAPVLATRNLLRGFLVGLPTGQAMARKMGLPVLEGQSLLDALPTPELKAAAAPFKDRSPLWFYVLAEAGAASGGKGETLGPLGSRIILETLHNLVLHSEVSILREANPGRYRSTLSDIIKLAAEQDQ